MLINDLISLVMQIPPMLAAQWAAWFFAGLVLSIWSRREKSRLVVHKVPKHKSGVRPPAKPSKSVPLSSGDAFGELEQLLDDKPSGMHRRPGDESPVLAEAQPLVAPQSLP
jgi:hypothetical protein